MSIEPVAYINVESRRLEWAKPIEWHTPTVVNLEPVPLYTQQEWVGLTDDEIWETGSKLPLSKDGIIKFFRVIEAKLKDKNTHE